MLIYLNGEQRTAAHGSTLFGYLNELALIGKRMAVELNDEIVPKSRYSEVLLKDGDRLEVVVAVGGG